MKIGDFDLDDHILVVAEIGNNHEGSPDRAQEMVRLAARAGAGAVKFQTFKTAHFVSRKDRERYDRLKSFELSQEDFGRLSHAARSEGLLFLSTPFDLESAAFLNPIVDAFKIASGDNNFYPLIQRIAETGKPILMSTGLADSVQLKKSVSMIYDTWEKLSIHQSLALLHCVSAYPVPDDQANLNAVKSLQETMRCTVGYSDHTLGIQAALIAAALGSRIIEKHFTMDKNFSDFRDHHLSSDFNEMSLLVKSIKTLEAMMGSGTLQPQEAEITAIPSVRRSIAAKYALPAGTRLTTDDIMWIRPGKGIPPGQEDKVVGKILREAIAAGDIFSETQFVDQ